MIYQVAWLFRIKDILGNEYLWSTRDEDLNYYSCGIDAANIAENFICGGDAENIAQEFSTGKNAITITSGLYTGKVLPVTFSGVNQSLIDKVGKIEQIKLSIVDESLNASNFINGTCNLSLSIQAKGEESKITEVFSFKIYNCYRENELVTFQLKDKLYGLLESEFPKSSTYDDKLSANLEGYCEPFVFGSVYHALPLYRLPAGYSSGGTAENAPDNFATGGAAENIAEVKQSSLYFIDCYVIGPNNIDYSIEEIQSPVSSEIKEKFTVTESIVKYIDLPGDLLGVQFDIPGKGNPLYIVNGAFAPINCKYTRSDTFNITNPAFIIYLALYASGVPLDYESFLLAFKHYDDIGLTFSGAIEKKGALLDFINDLLCSCSAKLYHKNQCYAISTDNKRSIDESKILRDQSGKTSFTIQRNEESLSNGGYFQFNDNGPQEIFSEKYAVSDGGELINNDLLTISFIESIEDAARAAIYYFNETNLKKGDISFIGSSKTIGLNLGDNLYFDSGKYADAYGKITRKAISPDLKTRYELDLYNYEILFKEINPTQTTINGRTYFIDGGNP